MHFLLLIFRWSWWNLKCCVADDEQRWWWGLWFECRVWWRARKFVWRKRYVNHILPTRYDISVSVWSMQFTFLYCPTVIQYTAWKTLLESADFREKGSRFREKLKAVPRKNKRQKKKLTFCPNPPTILSSSGKKSKLCPNPLNILFLFRLTCTSLPRWVQVCPLLPRMCCFTRSLCNFSWRSKC
jgi:hypothetical protein